MTYGGRILIIDGDSSMQHLLSAVVRRNHLQPVVVGDGTSALLRVATEAFDTILLELTLSGTDGAEVLRVLSSVMPHLLRRVIVVTAAPEEVIRNCRQLPSVWKVLRKPLDVDLFDQELLACCAERERTARKPPHRATHEDLSLPIYRIVN
jgi:DNA-binding NtrC family response regulator